MDGLGDAINELIGCAAVVAATGWLVAIVLAALILAGVL